MTGRMLRVPPLFSCVTSALVLCAVLCGGPSFASTANDETNSAFTEAAEAISRGAFTDAIDKLELLADGGFVHPDASFNRALAYLGRARSPSALPGDHGRALASLKETLRLRPEDAHAQALLQKTRQELERKRVQSRAAQPIEATSPSRALVELLPENTWAGLTVLFSAFASLGLALRLFARRRPSTTAGPLALTGAVLASLGGLGGILTGAATVSAQSWRRSTEPAVVIAASARLLDAQGRPLSEPPLPEGTDVHLLEIQGSLARIERSNDAWVRRSDIRVLAPLP